MYKEESSMARQQKRWVYSLRDDPYFSLSFRNAPVQVHAAKGAGSDPRVKRTMPSRITLAMKVGSHSCKVREENMTCTSRGASKCRLYARPRVWKRASP